MEDICLHKHVYISCAENMGIRNRHYIYNTLHPECSLALPSSLEQLGGISKLDEGLTLLLVRGLL